MLNREKVMRGLECCILKDPDDRSDCEKCPYHNTGVITNAPCFNGMMAQVLALLKEQEPKLMTLDEVLTAEDFVWAEIYTPNKWSWCLIYVKISPVVSNDEIVKIEEDCGIGWTKSKADYGKRGFLDGGWRCWTSRPSPEQMRDTKWEGEDDAE